jgi:hypothetical protein
VPPPVGVSGFTKKRPHVAGAIQRGRAHHFESVAKQIAGFAGGRRFTRWSKFEIIICESTGFSPCPAGDFSEQSELGNWQCVEAGAAGPCRTAFLTHAGVRDYQFQTGWVLCGNCLSEDIIGAFRVATAENRTRKPIAEPVCESREVPMCCRRELAGSSSSTTGRSVVWRSCSNCAFISNRRRGGAVPTRIR